MSGFEGRVFLTKAEYDTYLRRMPVRYIRKKHDNLCAVCGLPGTVDNPLQHSHRVGFHQGIKRFGLTPDYLDGHSNIVSAHRSLCNARAEMADQEVLEYLQNQGLTLPDHLVTP